MVKGSVGFCPRLSLGKGDSKSFEYVQTASYLLTENDGQDQARVIYSLNIVSETMVVRSHSHSQSGFGSMT